MKCWFIVFIIISLNGFSQPKLTLGKDQLLFNGKNFDGWHQSYDNQGVERDLFSTKDGLIHAYATQTALSTQSFGGLITDKEYSNYVLTLEYKWGVKKFKPRDESVRDAGVLFHVFGNENIWPAGVECQIQEGDTGDLWIVKAQASTTVDPQNKNFDVNGLLVTAGTLSSEYNRFARSYYWEKEGWNKVVLVVKGDNAKFYINDHFVNEAIAMKKWDAKLNAWIPLTKGKILLQAEGSEIFYKNVLLQEIKE
jgi:hypothetical protein